MEYFTDQIENEQVDRPLQSRNLQLTCVYSHVYSFHTTWPPHARRERSDFDAPQILFEILETAAKHMVKKVVKQNIFA